MATKSMIGICGIKLESKACESMCDGKGIDLLVSKKTVR
jgi:hypothetical protein